MQTLHTAFRDEGMMSCPRVVCGRSARNGSMSGGLETSRLAHPASRRLYWKPFQVHVQVTANGQSTETDLLMLVFCNSREFGTGARISPLPVLTTVWQSSVVSKPPLRSLPLAFLYLYTNRADRLPYIHSIPTTEAIVAQDGHHSPS